MLIFEILEQISESETIAVDKSIRELKRLKKAYADGRWRKMKGIFTHESGWYPYHQSGPAGERSSAGAAG